MSTTKVVLIFVILTGAIFFALASDPEPLQDLCVALPNSGVRVNGFACKAESNVTESDFFFSGIGKPGVINNTVGSLVTTANVDKIPGLNTLGVSLARIDYKPGGINPPHTHPRATEVVFVLEGELDVAFITTSNKLISKKIKKGEVFVFPIGLVHYQKNNGDTLASVIAAFNSQLPGALSVASALFSSKPAVPDEVLANTFQMDATVAETIKTKFAPKKG
ncbi:germin-like protein subfamily 2 member 4 [Arachis stenosperma]|uniref:germin-like protein subfamily 2 member 4 n=1 Tax=Arachis stenosperma TaxID=217475 RepID=UPI0025AD3F5B|nr:germin-like protein subfamily 2 member 4 [Arachis stenosperma]